MRDTVECFVKINVQMIGRASHLYIAGYYIVDVVTTSVIFETPMLAFVNERKFLRKLYELVIEKSSCQLLETLDEADRAIILGLSGVSLFE